MTTQASRQSLIDKWSNFATPYQTIPFSSISIDDYLPSFRIAMELHTEEVKQIANSSEAPTFANTIEALESSGEMLSRIQYCFYNLLNAETNDTMDAIAAEISPEETAHNNAIYQNAQLFARVKSIYEKRESLGLSTEQMKLLLITYESFEQMGATLSSEDQKTFTELSTKLTSLTLQFGQNVLKATNAYTLHITDLNQLRGLPSSSLEAAAAVAKSQGKEGYVFTLKAPSYVPFMKYCADESLRKQMWEAYNSRSTSGETDNRTIACEIASTRLAIAKLLGYENHADKVLRRRMAESAANVYHLLDELLEAYKPTALAEVEAVKKMAGGKDVMPWDWSYYSEMLRQQQYEISDEQVKPYFELENVKRGVFGLATQLYGLTFERDSSIEVYHPEVEAFRVLDKDGSFLSILYTDFFPRDGKSGGAWMTEFKPQWMETDGTDSRPHISIVMNFSRPTDSLPSLLTFDELTTFLHEFGHAIHGMVARGHYASLSGTNVYRDFVELPSQLMENWALETEYLDSFARHYQTGERIPSVLIEKIKRAANFNCGYATLRQLSFGYLDMAWHTLTSPFDGDVKAFEDKAWAKTQLLPSIPIAIMSTNFTHIFDGGYSAGYYGYKWAEVLDADAFSVFQSEGIFNQQTAARFRTEVLEKGGTEHPATLYRRFKGGDWSIDALLRRNGIKK